MSHCEFMVTVYHSQGLEQHLNVFSKDGWELVTVIPVDREWRQLVWRKAVQEVKP